MLGRGASQSFLGADLEHSLTKLPGVLPAFVGALLEHSLEQVEGGYSFGIDGDGLLGIQSEHVPIALPVDDHLDIKQRAEKIHDLLQFGLIELHRDIGVDQFAENHRFRCAGRWILLERGGLHGDARPCDGQASDEQAQGDQDLGGVRGRHVRASGVGQLTVDSV
ncbi:MAG: hypothetical protein CMJ41_07875 [Phycisphaerae bacterium]|nr:hypothetical protein [Phycisphaerae bacterium]